MLSRTTELSVGIMTMPVPLPQKRFFSTNVRASGPWSPPPVLTVCPAIPNSSHIDVKALRITYDGPIMQP